MHANSPFIRHLKYIAPFYTRCAFTSNAFMLLEESTSYLLLVFSPVSVRDISLLFSLASGVILWFQFQRVLESYCRAFNLNLVGHAYVPLCISLAGIGDVHLVYFSLMRKLRACSFSSSVTVILCFIGSIRKDPNCLV